MKRKTEEEEIDIEIITNYSPWLSSMKTTYKHKLVDPTYKQ